MTVDEEPGLSTSYTIESSLYDSCMVEYVQNISFREELTYIQQIMYLKANSNSSYEKGWVEFSFLARSDFRWEISITAA